MRLKLGVGCGTGLGGLGMSPVNGCSGRVRASTEVVLVNQVMDALRTQLQQFGLSQSFTDIEMPSAVILAKMELNGMGEYLYLYLMAWVSTCVCT